MKYYENGQIWQLDQQVGVHREDISDLLTLTDERGKYAPFTAGNPARTAVFFDQAEKYGDILLKKLLMFERNVTVLDFAIIFPTQATHLWEMYCGKCNCNSYRFYASLDAENSELFIKALVRL